VQVQEYADLDALGLAQLLRSRQVTAEEVLAAALRAHEQVFGQVSPYVDVYADRAHAAIEAGLPQGPFTGVPFALKDLWTAWAGTPTGNGSRLFAGTSAASDDELVRRCAAAGLVILAKTKTAELGVSPTTEAAVDGPAANPWDVTRSAGGSSGGAAAAVAAGLLPMAHATDGGGSIRIPASRCGLFGLKPTRGRVSSAPRGEGWGGLSAQHVVSRTVRDSAAALDVLAGPAAGDPYWAPPGSESYLSELARPPRRLRVGLCTRSVNGATVDEQVRQAALRTAQRFADLGHDVVEVSWPVTPEQVAAVQGGLIPAHVAAAVDARLAELGRAQREDDLEPVTAAFAEWGRQATARDLIGATQTMHEMSRRTAQLFDGVDVVVSPTCGDVVPPLGLLDGSDLDRFIANVGPSGAFASLANITGQPAMSLPLDLAQDGTPIGSQVMGRFGDEATLLRLAGQVEQAHPWPRTAPALVGA
jgi:amidase/6-aminohexanoate-cyclic-dimer hydrolase